MFKDMLSWPTSDTYNRIHDIYGPGAFLGWLLLAYGTLVQMIGIRKSLSMQTTLDKDLIFVIGYPVFAVFHLLYQVWTFPGPPNEMWLATEELYAPYSKAVHASATVCFWGIGINAISAVGLHFRQWKTQKFAVITAAGFLFLALYIAALKAELSFGIILASLVFVGGPVLITTCNFSLPLALIPLAYGTSSLYNTLSNPRRPDMKTRLITVLQTLWFCLASAGLCLGTLSVAIPLSNTMFPKSNHSVQDLGQLHPLVFGCLNAAWSCSSIDWRYLVEGWVILGRNEDSIILGNTREALRTKPRL